jgi:hypothetical protein
MNNLIRESKKSGLPGAAAGRMLKLAGTAFFILGIIACIAGYSVYAMDTGAAHGVLAAFPAGFVLADCTVRQLLTGYENCTRAEGKTIALILTDPSAGYSTDAAAFNTALAGYVYDTTILKMYPIGSITGNTLSGGDVKTADVGFSGAKPVGINVVNEVYTIDGGDCLYKQLTALNGRTMRAFRVDDGNYIYGTFLERNGETVSAGFKVTVYVTSSKSDGSAAYTLNVTLYYSAAYEVERINMFAFHINEIPSGLVGVELVKHASGGCSVVSVCSRNDYTPDYAGDWDTNMFVNTSGGKPTAVTYSAATQKLTITPAASYKVERGSVLKAGDIFGLEGIDKYTAV